MKLGVHLTQLFQEKMFENVDDEQFGSRPARNFFVPELGLNRL